MGQRLQKIIAAAGLASRREAERWIRAGRVSVDGHKATLGDGAAPGATITIDGKPITAAAQESAAHRHLLYHKPAGQICSRSDTHGRPTVFDFLPPVPGGRWISVGRLDFNTTGLLLFTTDGALANTLMHPSARLVRRYAVRVRGSPDKTAVQTLLTGVQLDDGPARFEAVEKNADGASNTSFDVELIGGRNREVRRLWAAVGYEVGRLTRVKFGPLALPRDLRRGEWRELRTHEVEALYAFVTDAG